MENNLTVHAEICDLRSVQEETLAAYEKISIKADVILVNERARALLGRYPVSVNCDTMLECEGEVSLRTINGSFTLDGASAPQVKTILCVNGPLFIMPDAGPMLHSYLHIVANGPVQCPKSLMGQMNNLLVNGPMQCYPDGAVRLKRTAVIDRTFALRAKPVLYWAGARLVMLDPALDAAALAAKGCSFTSREAIVAESLTESVASLLDEQTDILVVPDGTRLVQDDLELTDTALQRYGPRLYVLGDLSVTEAGRGALAKLEYLCVRGAVELAAGLKDEFGAVRADYKDLRLLRGRSIKKLPMVNIDRRLLEGETDGVTVSGCGVVRLGEDIPDRLILEKLTLCGCGMAICSEAQCAAVTAVSSNVGTIGSGEEHREENQAGSGHSVNAEQYVM